MNRTIFSLALTSAYCAPGAATADATIRLDHFDWSGGGLVAEISEDERATLSDYEITEETFDFFNAGNWQFGTAFGAPYDGGLLGPRPSSVGESLRFGPEAVYVNGFFSNFWFPEGVAVFDASAPDSPDEEKDVGVFLEGNQALDIPAETFAIRAPDDLEMYAWDGPSTLIVRGGTLVANATIGTTSRLLTAPEHAEGEVAEYIPSGDIQPATVVLQGGNIAGNWDFADFVTSEYQRGSIASRLIIIDGANIAAANLSKPLQNLLVSADAEVILPSVFQIDGDIENNGILNLSSSVVGPQEFLIGQRNALAQTASFQGSGEVVLDESDDRILGNQSTNRNTTTVLTNGEGHTIRGQGLIAIALENEGTVRAEGGTLSISTLQSNTGLLEIASDGQLEFTATRLPTRQIMLDAGNLAYEDGATLGSSSFHSITIDGEGTLNLEHNLRVSGTITNNGSLDLLERGGGDEEIKIGVSNSSNKTAEFAGTGELVMDTDGARIVANGTTNQFTTTSLTNGADHTIRGQGGIFVDLTNKGTIRAEGGELQLNRVTENSGEVQIVEDAKLTVEARTSYNQSYLDLGLVKYEDGASLGRSRFRNATFEGEGKLYTDGGLNFAGTLTHDGTIQIVDEADETETILIGPSNSTRRQAAFAGSGELVLSEGGTNLVGNGSTNRTEVFLSNGVNHTIRGRGGIFANLTNDGTIRAEGGELRLQSGASGTGTFEVASDATLSSGGTRFQAKTIRVEEGGQLEWSNPQGLTLEVVNFFGDLVQNGGVYAPGASPAQSQIDGDYTLGGGGILEMEFAGLTAGLFDELTITGDFFINDGSLSLFELSPFEFQPNQYFEIIDVAGDVFGEFDGLTEGSLISGFSEDLFITYLAGDGNDIAVFTAGGTPTAPIPLPGSVLGLLTALGGLGYLRNKKSR